MGPRASLDILEKSLLPLQGVELQTTQPLA